ncbi:phosphoribosyltransferase family protein [Saprospiraceae bacterium]|nr:phosphoribosyltransferase family protein [Saprospiraceae bacterium]
MLILDQEQIKQKTKRLAIEILERNYGEKEIYLAGINSNGLKFAKNLGFYAKRNTDAEIHYLNIRVNAANPLAEDVILDIDKESLRNKVVVIVDDVANTGRTLFYGFKPLLETLAKKVEIAVLVDRKHKNFPISPNYVGLALATTMGENIEVRLQGADERSVHLV